MYIDQVSLTDGAHLPIGKVSQQAIRKTGVGPILCAAQPDVVSTANAEFAVSWLQQNAASNGCDLVVNGAIVNASANSVAEFAVSGNAGNVLAAVWREW